MSDTAIVSEGPGWAGQPRPTLGVTLVLLLLAGCATAVHNPTTPLHVRVEWFRSGELVTADVYDTGAGIFEDNTAFRLTPDDVAAVRRVVSQSGFSSMPVHFGEAEDDLLKMQGKVVVNDGSTEKTVVQLIDGPRSEELATVASHVLNLATAAAANGVRTSDLADGLKRIVSGEIPVETLRVTAQRRDDRTPASEDGWLLIVRGPEALARTFDRRTGFGPPRQWLLTAEELRQMASMLIRDGVASFPPSLYAPMYTELRVEVLGHVLDLQARPYEGVTAETHGDKQRAFEHTLAGLRRLAVPSL